MNKIKFLSCAVMAAFFAMGITSCEKENFDTKVDIDTPTIQIPGVDTPEGYKPGDAVVSITPQVLAVINGEMKNVTNEATVTYNGKEKLEYTVTDGAIAAMDVKVVASYDYEVNGETKAYTAEYTIKVPALSAGQVAVYTPTLVISINFTTDEPSTDEPGTDEPGTDDGETVSLGLVTEEVEGSAVVTKTASEIELNNESNFYYTNVSTESTGLKYGTFISNIKVEAGYEENKDVQAILGSYNQGVNDYQIKLTGITLWPETKACFAVEAVKETKSYIVKEVFETRANTEKTAATFTVEDYSYIVSTTATYYNAGVGHSGNGHAHSQGQGHAHGHGHGTDNAGGGIVWGNN